ncbi:MAG: phenylalanine--tRNA ligase subunit beta, partial [Ruminococcus sp.]|nr:phenylalanine--tRNA ligase subunit beta [Ruminococcus sp.]
PETNLCNEHKKLCITLFSKTKSTEQIYFELRDMLAVIADDIKHETLSFEKIEATHSYQHPKNLNAVICGGKTIGEIGVVYPTVSKKIDKKASIVYAEIDVADFAVIDSKNMTYDEPSKYPEMEVDLTFMSERFAPIGKTIDDINSPLVKKVSVADTYKDEAGKSITVRILFSDKNKTLTREEVSAVTDKIIENLALQGISLKA